MESRLLRSVMTDSWTGKRALTFIYKRGVTSDHSAEEARHVGRFSELYGLMYGELRIFLEIGISVVKMRALQMLS